MMSCLAARARGLMACFAPERRVDDRHGLKAYDVESYRFEVARSNDTEFTFVRPAA